MASVILSWWDDSAVSETWLIVNSLSFLVKFIFSFFYGSYTLMITYHLGMKKLKSKETTTKEVNEPMLNQRAHIDNSNFET